MKNKSILKIIFTILLLYIELLAQDQPQNNQPIIQELQSNTQDNQLAQNTQTLEENQVLQTNQPTQDNQLQSQLEPKTKDLYLEYISYPKRVFTNEKFEVKLKAIILTDTSKYDKIISTFTQEDNIKLLTKDVIWKQTKQNIFTTTLIYKATNDAFELPKITLALLKDDNVVDFISIDSPKIKYEKIAINQKLFSSVIATNLEVITTKTKQYSNKLLHTTLTLRATKGNLEDFHLNGYKEQGIKILNGIYDEQELYYYVMIPIQTKQISFTYYNKLKKDFIKLNIPIILDEELVSTQTELNPYNSSLLLYKQILIACFLVIFILLYLFTKRIFYLGGVVLFLIVLVFYFMPNKKILIQSGTKIYILPTKHSTIFKILKNKKVVEVINETDKFIKILLNDETIGWIKKENVR